MASSERGRFITSNHAFSIFVVNMKEFQELDDLSKYKSQKLGKKVDMINL
jgi:hypothetical protein